MRAISLDRILVFSRVLFVFLLFLGNDSVYGLSENYLNVMQRYSDLGKISEDFSEAKLEDIFNEEKKRGKTGLKIELPDTSVDVRSNFKEESLRSKIYNIARRTKMLVSFKPKVESSSLRFSEELYYPGYIPKKSSKEKLSQIFQEASEKGYVGIYIDLPENADFLDDTSKDYKFYNLLLETAAANSMQVATLPLNKAQKARLARSVGEFNVNKSEIHPVLYTSQFGFEQKFSKFLRSEQNPYGLLRMERIKFSELRLPLAKKDKYAKQNRVVAQLFNYRFVDIEAIVAELYLAGYTHIHISPILASLKKKKWYARYQPTELRIIEGPLGNEEEYFALIEAIKSYAEEHNLPPIQIIQDIALSHMAHYPSVVETEADTQGEIDQARIMEQWPILTYPYPSNEFKKARKFYYAWNKRLQKWVRKRIMKPLFKSKNIVNKDDQSYAVIGSTEVLNQTPNAKDYKQKFQAIFYRLNDDRVEFGLPSMNVGISSEYVSKLVNWRDYVSPETARLVESTIKDYQDYVLKSQGHTDQEEQQYWHHFQIALTHTLAPYSDHLLNLDEENIRAYVIRINGDADDVPPNFKTLLEQRQAIIRFKQVFGVVNWRMDALKHILKDYLRFLFADILDFEGSPEPLLTEDQTVLGEIIPEGEKPWKEWMKGYADIIPNMLLYDFNLLKDIKNALGLGGNLTTFITDHILNKKIDGIPEEMKLIMTYNHDLERNNGAFDHFIFEENRMHDEVLAFILIFGMNGTPYVYSDRGVDYEETDETKSDRYKHFFQKQFLKHMIQFKKLTYNLPLWWRQDLVDSRENIVFATRGSEAFFVINKSSEEYNIGKSRKEQWHNKAEINAFNLEDGIYYNLTADSVHHEKGPHIKMDHIFIKDSSIEFNHLKIPSRIGGMYIKIRDLDHASEILSDEQLRDFVQRLRREKIPERLRDKFPLDDISTYMQN